MIYNIHYDICAVIISFFLFFCLYITKGTKKAANKVFLLLIIAELLASIADIFSAVTSSYVHEYSIFVRDLTNYAYLVIYNCMPFLFLLYIIMAFEIHHKISKMQWFQLSLPLLLDFIAFALNPALRWIFYYDEELNYLHGNMMVLLYINAFLYLVLSIVVIVKYGRAISLFKRFALVLFITFAACPVIIQLFIPTMLIELFFHSLGMLGALLAIDNEEETYNSITQIYNRNLFMNDVSLAIQTGVAFDMIILKMPKMEYMNATLGIQCMRGFETEIASYLNGLSKNLHVYDCENGHFAILLYKNRDAVREELLSVIVERFQSEWIFEDTRMVFPIQICTIKVPRDANTIDQVMFIVDRVYENKGNHKKVTILDNLGDYTRAIEVEQALERGIETHSFEVYYQPIYHCKTGKVHSAEALLRLRDEKLGFIAPDEFIPIAEKNGLIIDLGVFVLEEVCKGFAEGFFQKIGIQYVEVNLSLIQCMNKNLVSDFVAILENYQVPAGCINLEITESAAANNEAGLQQTIHELKNVGFTFSLDDYGTGYSNFSYMFDMPFRIIKLDKSILWKAEDNTNARIILTDTIKMMKRMNLEIVVEGVETEEQRMLLEELDCDYLQGYFFSKPIRKKEFMEYCSASMKISKQDN